MSEYHENATGCTVSVSHITGDIVCQRPGPDCDCMIRARRPDSDEIESGPIDPGYAGDENVFAAPGEYANGLERFCVIESTPGYLPEEDDDPGTFDEYSEAVAYANELADELEEQGYNVDRSWASADNYYAIHAERSDTVAPDLGRTIEVRKVEAE